MSTALPTVGRATAAIAETFRQNKVNPETGGGTPFLSFDSKRTGEWLFGVEKEPCTGEVFALDLTSIKHGWILWHQRKANRRLVPINADLPEPQEDIHYTDAKGKPQVDSANEGRAIEGTFDDGTRFLFETNSLGGRKAVDSVLQHLFSRAQQGSPFLYPHIQLESDSYEHKEYGLVYNPVFTVVAWYDEAGTEETETRAIAAPVAEEAPAPARTRRGAAPADPEPEAAPEPEEAPQQRRRRRPAA